MARRIGECLRFAWVFAMAAALPAGAAVAASELVAGTQAHLAALAATEGFSGVVLIAKDGKPLLQKAYGLANRADGIRNVAATKFNIASMGKMFTAVAIMQLVEAGKVALEDKVGKHLPSYPNAVVRDTVTIHQLLTHTSGMGDFLAKYAKTAKDGYRSVADYLPLFGDETPEFTPGSQLAYSNSGYMVLGLIIEAASGETYFDYVRKHIFEPAGMKDTEALELDYSTSHMAIGYVRSADRPGVWQNNLYTNVVKGSPAGGSYSTAGDLLKFSEALTRHRLLSEAGTALMTTGKVNYRSGKYAYGFVEEVINGHRVIGHGGGHYGIADELTIVMDLGYTVVLLTNGEVDAFWNIQNYIKQQLLGNTPESDGYYLTRRAIDATLKSGYAAGIAALQDNTAGRARLRSGLISQVGSRLIWERRPAQAIDVLRLNLFAFPGDSSGYSDLGDAYDRLGNTREAIALYEKYTTMEPDDAEAKQKLRLLREK